MATEQIVGASASESGLSGRPAVSHSVDADFCEHRRCRVCPSGASAWVHPISVPELCQRLGTLFDLELPCSVHFNAPRTPTGYRATITRCEHIDGRLSLSGEHFSVHLRDDRLDAACVTRVLDGDRYRRTIELRDRAGLLRVRILGLPGAECPEIWGDIIDSFVTAGCLGKGSSLQ